MAGAGVPRLWARRGDVGIAPYKKAAGKLYVGADAHIRPCGYVQRIGRRAGRAQKEPPPGGSFSLSINPLYGVIGSFTQGEFEGAKPTSNKIKCRAKPCLARLAWSEATIFVPQGGTKITTLFQAVEKAGGFFDSLKAAFGGPFGHIPA